MTEKRDFFADTPVPLDQAHDPFAIDNDPFSDVLELIRIRGNTVFTCALSAPFSVSFPQGRHYLHIIRSGAVTISASGGHTPVHAEQGDLVMLRGNGHTVSDGSGVRSVHVMDLAREHYDRERLTLGQGDVTWMCGDFGFDGVLASRLLSVLPPVTVVKGLRDRPFEWLELSCHFILDEALHPRPGGAAMISRLLDVIFVQFLRTWAADGEVGRGWLSSALDPRIGHVMAAMHAAPEKPWSVVELAERANLSRSAFSERFLRVVGQTPLNYLGTWRMDRAAEFLRYGRASVGEIAERVGYASEAAFSRAFKGRYGVSPTQWRKIGSP
ncbi:AraC family transcriptional regulator [Dyella monticola]|uniref:AraC family transcriptional regulator n=1 Tax=Dyella monticola TaxID=1927958 RepID=A0A370WXK3_9GAMM|nr:AraC family transcriptional regulator [Dyella monticola]RDS80864.1 AraC family transcriptional regulator [Dyella monticola]